MFKRLIQALSGKPADATPSATHRRDTAPALAPESAQAQLITVYDVHGRELQITRADWRDKMLMPQLETKWSDADALYPLIVNALNDGFFAEVEPASGRLLEIDPDIERSHVVRAIILMKRGALDEAERVLCDATGKVGETGTLLTNLAKVQESRGSAQQADATLWKAIVLDPNQDNGLGWWLARQRERGGDDGYRAALQKAAGLPGSWRAALYLGRQRLDAGDVSAALDYFRTVLAKAAHSHDALLTISGDLGNAGRITELVDLVGPCYDPGMHGPQVGRNLVQAYLQLDRLDEGEALLGRLYALNMPPFKQHLDSLAGQYQERRRENTPPRPVESAGLELVSLPFELPIWMYGLRDPQWLFDPKPASARRVVFLMLGKISNEVEQVEEQREDDVGRLSRAIPLYLAESVYEWTALHATSLVTVVVGGGPVVYGAMDEAGERHAAAQLANHADVVVTGAIGKDGDAWTVELGFWDTARVELMGRESLSAASSGLDAAVLELERRVLARLGGAQVRPHDAIYQRPTVEQMQPYLNALAQSLMLGLVANQMVPRGAMWGERNMLEWPLRMALHWSDQEVLRALYLSGISHAARYGSDVLAEFEERSFALSRDMCSRKSRLADLHPLLLHAFNRTDALAAARRDTRDERRLAWMDRVVAAVPAR